MKAVGPVAQAISEGFKLVGQILKGSDRRKMEKAIEYGERFIRRYEKITDDQDETLQKYAEKFFKHN